MKRIQQNMNSGSTATHLSRHAHKAHTFSQSKAYTRTPPMQNRLSVLLFSFFCTCVRLFTYVYMKKYAVSLLSHDVPMCALYVCDKSDARNLHTFIHVCGAINTAPKLSNKIFSVREDGKIYQKRKPISCNK